MNSSEFDALRDVCLTGAQGKQNQLYQAIKERILAGRLTPGSRLPSSRALASQLQLSRNTINGALDQLKAEGYVQTKKGAGHYVAIDLPDNYFKSQAKGSTQFASLPSEMPLSRIGKTLLSDSKIRVYQNTSFEAGLPDLSAFPIKIWSHIYHRQSLRTSLLGYDAIQGSEHLRKVLAAYLKSSRGLDCSAEQIIITVGAQQAANIAIQVILDAGDEVYLEEPGYIGMREAFKAHQCKITGIPVGKNGLLVSHLPKRPKGKLLCVTPTHQYPMGGIMPLANRLQTLQWAAENKVWILEDDYDSEYHYDHKPIAAMQGLGLSNQVIYIGSFSKVLYPSLRLGYMVVPRHLVSACAKTKNRIAGQTPMVEQATVAEFIEEGHFVRHLRKMRNLYHDKFKTIIASCREHLGEFAEPEYTGAGMHIVLIFKPALNEAGLSDIAVVEALKEQGLSASPLSTYFIGQLKQQGLVLGFANTKVQDIDQGIRTLGEIISGLLKA